MRKGITERCEFRRIPQANFTVVEPREECLAVGTEPQAVSRGPQGGGAAANGARGRIAQPDRPVSADKQQGLAVGTETETVPITQQPAGERERSPEGCAGDRVPEP